MQNKQDAEDLAQTIFMKVFQALPSFRRQSKFSTWLYTITVNTCLNYQDKMQRRPWWRRADDIEEMAETYKQDEELLSLLIRSLEQDSLKKAIDHTMAQLNPASREVLQLRFFEELDYNSISHKLSIGLSATKMRLKRARQEFKILFKSRQKD